MATNITIKATLNQDGTIACSWTSVAGVKEYVVDIKRESSNTAFYTKVTTATSCVSTDKVIQGSIYKINIWANNANRVTIASGKLNLTVPSDFYVRNLTVPTNIKATPSTASIQVSFSSVSGATSYDILFDGKVYNTTKTTYNFTGLASNSTHTIAVRAKNSNTTSAYSATQTVITKTVIPGMPAGIKMSSTEN